MSAYLANYQDSRYALSASARFNTNSTATTRYLWVSGVNTPRCAMQTPSNWIGDLKTNGDVYVAVGTSISSVGYYEGGSPSPAIIGDTAISSRETALTVTEIPTW